MRGMIASGANHLRPLPDGRRAMAGTGCPDGAGGAGPRTAWLRGVAGIVPRWQTLPVCGLTWIPAHVPPAS